MVAVAGMTCLGFVVSVICLAVAERSEYEGMTVVASVIGILLGGVLGLYLASHTSAGRDIIWWYPLGMFAALVLVGAVTLVRRLMNRRDERERTGRVTGNRDAGLAQLDGPAQRHGLPTTSVVRRELGGK